MTDKEREELHLLLKDMDVPVMRKDARITANCRWLMSNLGFNNSKHPNYPRAKQILKEITKKLKKESVSE